MGSGRRDRDEDEFELDGQAFVALDGGPDFKFSEAIWFKVCWESQEEVDWYWEKLAAGGAAAPSGRLEDGLGLSWRISPTSLARPGGVHRRS